jgi:2-succinyl-6-hydroxy-2,4-cyclohexadiene-1-carboxylate synthase
MGYQLHYQFHDQFHYRAQPNSLKDFSPRTLPIVLFLHGFLGSGEDFGPVIEPLSDDYHCLTIDLPGHGQTRVTGANEQYGMVPTAMAIVELLDRLGIPQCVLVGYSMGGRLALYLALHFPHRFPQSVLVSASPGLEQAADRQARLQHDWDLARQLEADFPGFLERWYGQPLFQSLRRLPQFAALQQRRSHNRPPELAQSLRYLSTGRQPALWAALSQHSAPLLLLVGEDDRKFCQINQAMGDCCAAAQVAIVPNCGHAPHLEQPAAFVQQVRSFLGKPEDCPVVGKDRE